jgi:hypothetical protein
MSNSFDNPTQSEAPIVNLLNVDYSKMSVEEVRAHVSKLRELRSVPAQREAAVKKTARVVKDKAAGIDMSALL